jgi:hypothetical protein
MTGVIRKATALVVLGLVAATVAVAGVPSGAQSHGPVNGFVDLVSCDGVGALPPAAKYKATFTVHDLGDAPVSGAVISIVFCSDVKIYTAIPGGTVVCPTFTNTAVTNALGIATVEVSGAGYNTNGAVYGTSGLQCATWYANGAAMGCLDVATFDEDGKTALAKQGVGGSDLTAWLSDYVAYTTFGAPRYAPRSNFSHLNFNDGPDLTAWLGYYTSGPAYNSSCGTLCN